MMKERTAVSVSALNRYVRLLLEQDSRLTDIRIRGEISNFIHHRSGHCYFSLKDESSSVKAVMFRTDAQGLRFEPQNGMCVVADCRVSLYERDGSFQVYVQHLFPDGVGAIRLAFEQLKARLEKEGLFDVRNKVALPQMPAAVGVITSGTGAALQDIRNVLTRRFPLTRLLVYPVQVQGEEAAPEIAHAITRLDEAGLADVMIVARGGGSAEDLWVFNDERIARAAYRCRTPLISAIGHEIDFTILDFVADCRAPTPSAAAELAVPAADTLLQGLAERRRWLCENMDDRLARTRQQWSGIAENPLWQQSAQQLDARWQQLQTASAQIVRLAQETLQQKQQQLSRQLQLTESLSPLSVLRRGYVMVKKQGAYLSPDALQPGDEIELEAARQTVACTVHRIAPK